MTSELTRRDESGVWSRRGFFKGFAIAGCGLVTSRREAFSATQPDDPKEDRASAGARYPLQVPVETPPAMPLLSCAPAMVNMGDGRLRRVLAYTAASQGRPGSPALEIG